MLQHLSFYQTPVGIQMGEHFSHLSMGQNQIGIGQVLFTRATHLGYHLTHGSGQPILGFPIGSIWGYSIFDNHTHPLGPRENCAALQGSNSCGT